MSARSCPVKCVEPCRLGRGPISSTRRAWRPKGQCATSRSRRCTRCKWQRRRWASHAGSRRRKRNENAAVRTCKVYSYYLLLINCINSGFSHEAHKVHLRIRILYTQECLPSGVSFIGGGLGDLEYICDTVLNVKRGGFTKISPFFMIKSIYNIPAASVAMNYKLKVHTFDANSTNIRIRDLVLTDWESFHLNNRARVEQSPQRARAVCTSWGTRSVWSDRATLT